MIFDSALAEMEVGGDILAGMTGKNHRHDLTLPRRQASQVDRRFRPPGGGPAGRKGTGHNIPPGFFPVASLSDEGMHGGGRR